MSLYYGKPSSIRESMLSSLEASQLPQDSKSRCGGSINGSGIESFADMQRIVSTNAGSKLVFHVKRDRRLRHAEATPALKEVKISLGTLTGSASSVFNIMLQPNIPGPRASVILNPWKIGHRASLFIIAGPSSLWGLVRRSRQFGDVGGRCDCAAFGPSRAALASIRSAAMRSALGIDRVADLFRFRCSMAYLLSMPSRPCAGAPCGQGTGDGVRIGLGLVLMLMVFATYNDILHSGRHNAPLNGVAVGTSWNKMKLQRNSCWPSGKIGYKRGNNGIGRS